MANTPFRLWRRQLSGGQLRALPRGSLLLDFAVNFDTKKLKKLKINIDKSRGYMYNNYCRVTVTNLILKDVPK